MTRLSTLALALALVTPLAACTEEADSAEFREVLEFVDGMALDSDDGAFRVVLASEDGRLGTGRNDLIVRVGFHDPNDPDAEGRGIPGAKLEVEAWMPDAEVAMQSDIEVAYLGDGAYEVENVVLDRAGVWNFDIEIRVGEGMVETVSLAFEVDDLDYRG
ncbi:MAG: FixH family protein [Enhygromyxa sp.]